MDRRSGAVLGTVVATTAVLASLPSVAPASASGRPAAITVSLNRTSIPATGVLQPRPVRMHISDPHHQVATPYVVDPARPRITARVRDAAGRPVAGATVVFHSSGRARFGTVHDHGNGTYTAAVISSPVPGAERLWASTARGSVRSRRARLVETFGALHTSGSHILDAAGRVVRLRGVNFRPSAPDPYLYNEFPPRRAFSALRSRWHVNVVRTFVDLDEWTRSCPVMRSNHAYDPYYQQAYRSFVRAMTERGVYVILVLGTAPRYTCDKSNHHQLPAHVSSNQRADAARFWHDFAEVFKSNPLVGFDLYNEPHHVSDTMWLNGGRFATIPTWSGVGMQKMYNSIRSTGATNLVFAEGPTWATRTPPSIISSKASQTWRTDIGAFNIVYAAHYYSCQSADPKYPKDGSPGPYTCPNGVTPPAPTTPCPASNETPSWDNPARVLDPWVAWRNAHALPIMENEFGWPGNSNPVDKCFVRRTIAYDEAHGIPWAAFHWVLWSDRQWALARHPGRFDVRPTVSGCPVYLALTGRSSCP